VKVVKTKNLMASFAIILVVFSTVGFAYSAWTDEVFIEGTIRMGEFIVGILYDPLPDQWGDEPVKLYETTNGYLEDGSNAPASGPGSFVPKAWVANTTYSLSCNRTSVHHDPQQSVSHVLELVTDNAYPQYDVHACFLLKNAGTIPAHIKCTFLGATSETEGEDPRPLVLIEEGWQYMMIHTGVMAWYNNGTIYDPVRDVDVIIWHIACQVPLNPRKPDVVQLEPCHEYETAFWYEFTQDSEECHTYKFALAIDAIQWNMDYEWDT
jgi:hypothetical protein